MTFRAMMMKMDRSGAKFFWLLLVLNFLSIRIELVELHRWRPKSPSPLPLSHITNNNTISSSKKLTTPYNSKTKNNDSTQRHNNQETEYISTVRKSLDSYIKAHQLGLRSSKLIGNGTFYVVFDCKHPSYLDSAKTKHQLSKNNELIRHRNDEIKSSVRGGNQKVECDLATNLWKEVTKEAPRLVVYDPKSKRFDFTLNEGHLRYLFKLSRGNKVPTSRHLNESLIVSVLKVFHHPRFFY